MNITEACASVKVRMESGVDEFALVIDLRIQRYLLRQGAIIAGVSQPNQLPVRMLTKIDFSEVFGLHILDVEDTNRCGGQQNVKYCESLVWRTLKCKERAVFLRNSRGKKRS
jgi:hypothetical protein